VAHRTSLAERQEFTVSGNSIPVSTPPLVVVLVCCLAIFLLTGMDAVMKGLVLAIGVYNTMLWRSIFATAAAGSLWTIRSRKLPARQLLALRALRGAVIAIITLLFFWGLGRLPLAEAIALSFIAPLIALYLASVVLGERIGRTAIFGSLVGMAGVVVIMAGKFGGAQLSTDALLGSAAILVSAIFYAYNLILARKQAQLAGPLEIAFFQNLSLLATFGLAAPWLATILPAEQWLETLVATALSLTGLVLLTWAFARAEAQYLIPTEYTAFVWAVILGWMFFDETVGWTTVLGTGLIVAGCLLVALTKPKLSEPIEAVAL